MVKKRHKKTSRNLIVGWMFVGPVVFGTLVFNVAPIFPTLWLSLTDWTGVNGGSWVGLQNYANMISDPVYWGSLLRTFIFTGGVVLLSYAGGLLEALLLDNALRGIRFFRTLFFLPVVTSTIAIGIVWNWLLNADFGLVNSILGSIGIPGPQWLDQSGWALFSVIIVSAWARMGYNMVILLGGLQSISPSLYESANLDGAPWYRKFWNITLPLLSPYTFFVVILGVINSFMAFDIIYAMTQGGPGYATSVYVYRLWLEAFRDYNMAYASAMAWILFAILALVTLFQWRMSRRWVFYQ